MNKSQIRKKIFKIRKQVSSKKFNLNLNYILHILKKERIKGKIIGGYYPYNYEINTLNLFKDLEKKNYKITLPKINDKAQMNFLLVNKRPSTSKQLWYSRANIKYQKKSKYPISTTCCF